MNNINLKWLAVGALLIALSVGGGVAIYNQTRGLRNNNAGNLKKSNNKWLGLSKLQSDNVFFTFVKPEYGIRAMFKTLMTYRSKGLDTIEKILKKYAPSSENKTQKYIDFVSKKIGINPSYKLNLSDYFGLIKAMITFENGINPYPDSLIKKGMKLK